jgi:TFIIF-interacting CTD phosphatase-like protein
VNVSRQRKLLVLDLDETLVYATEQRLSVAEEFKAGPYYVYLRPHLRPFLEFCVNRFDVGIWTSSSADYAQAVVMQLFGSLGPLKFVWSRTRCTRRYDHETQTEYWVKDLAKLRRIGYALERVIVIDDTAKKHERNYGNLVRVSEFEGQPEDNELLHLVRYLDALANIDNVRVVEKRGWRNTI